MMQASQTNRVITRVSDLLKPRWRLTVALLLPILFVVIILGDWFLGWHITGFFAYTAYVPEGTGGQALYYPGKTLWDLLDLLLLPLVVIGSTILVAWVYRQTQFAIAADHQAQTDILSEKRREQTIHLARKQHDEAYLQGYFSFLTDLLLHRGLRRAKADSDLAEVARLRTVLALAHLGRGYRKAIIHFLYEAGLIHVENTVISLRGIDLTEMEFEAIILKEANLQGVNLAKANLQYADLTGAFLEGANLAEVNLLETNLEGATYDQATTWPADFNPNEG